MRVASAATSPTTHHDGDKFVDLTGRLAVGEVKLLEFDEGCDRRDVTYHTQHLTMG